MEKAGIFEVTGKVATLFIIILIGIYAKKRKIADENSSKFLSAILLRVTQPLLIVASFQMEYEREKLVTAGWIFLMSAVFHIVVSAFAFLFYMPVGDYSKRNVYELATIFSNCGFLGYPILMVAFGENLGIFYGSFYTMFFNILIWTWGILVITRKKDGAKGKIKPLNIIINPGVTASIIGIILFVLKIKIPSVALQSMQLVGNMTFPLSMLIIGILAAELDYKAILTDYKNYIYVSVKLIVIPLLTFAVCKAFNLPQVIAYIAVLMSAMPTAANVAVFSETYGSDSKLAASLAGFSTLLFIFTVPLVIYLLNNFILS